MKRQSQNARAYQKKYKRHKSKLSPLSDLPKHLPPLPLTLLSFTTKPLPTSNLFHEALRSVDALDESDLYVWEQDPPYNCLEPAITPHEEHFTQNMVDVLLSQCWRLAKVARDECVLHFANGEVQDIL